MKTNRKFKFKKKLIGGLDEVDVLKKFKELNQQYQLILENYEKKIEDLNKKIEKLENKNM